MHSQTHFIDSNTVQSFPLERKLQAWDFCTQQFSHGLKITGI